jgi:Lar family restriction alleviation protein
MAAEQNIVAERAAPALQPCPFCGGTASAQRFGNRDGGASFAVWCDSCHISTAWMHGDDGAHRAIEAWNRRPSASIGEDGLPELQSIDTPEFRRMLNDPPNTSRPALVAHIDKKMRQYAHDAVAADRRAREAQPKELSARIDAFLDENLPKLAATPPQAAQGVKTWQERVGPDYNDSAEPTAHEIAMEAEIADLRAQLARQSQGAIYTCKGKGGKYELLGVAWPAGVLSSTLMVSNYPVYRDIKTGRMFVRTANDFDLRMELLAVAPKPEAPCGS